MVLYRVLEERYRPVLPVFNLKCDLASFDQAVGKALYSAVSPAQHFTRKFITKDKTPEREESNHLT